VPFESDLWKERIQFRDILRSKRTIAKDYEELKKELAVKYANDREKYTDLKWPFIKKVTESFST
jgi:GrpB-like predicted nucleotidyltransferase (UPF0157 family)